MGDIFKVYRRNKENILGKMRKIYGKVNKKGVLCKTKYIKYKGKFVKLSAFMNGKKAMKGGAKKALKMPLKKPLTRLGKHKRVAVIDNINDIKDKKIRNLYLKTFKKNAKLYIFADNKRWNGGEIRYSHDRDEPVLRKRNARVIHDFKVEARGMGSHTRVITSPKTELDYIRAIDNITIRMQRFGFDSPTSKMFEGINNLKYTIRASDASNASEDGTYYIRPSIEFVPYDKIIIYFYITKKGGFSQVTPTTTHTPTPINTDKKWIRMSIHITIFLKVMPEVVIEDSQYKLFSGHLHITSETENNKRYNIKTTLKGSRSTHTYLLGKDMEEMGEIMEKMGGDIFKAWSFDKTTHGVTDNALKLTLYKPDNNMWSECRNDGASVRLLTSVEEKEQIFDSCFKNLRFIFCNIFHILKTDTYPSTASTYCLPDVVSVKKITKPTPGGASSSSSTDTYLEYKVPKSTNYNNKINLSYYDTDNIVKFNGIINVNDLKNKKDAHSKPLSHTDTHHSVHSYSRSPPLGYSRSPPLGYSRSPPRLPRERRISPPLGYSRSPPRLPRERRISPPLGYSRSPPRLPRERIPSPPRMPRVPRERIPSPPRMPRERIPSPPRQPRQQREPIRHVRVMPIETRNVTRREKRNAEPHAETPFWGRVGRRRG
jgi:hypothetical protein